MPANFLPYQRYLTPLARKLRNRMTRAEIALWKHLKGKQMLGYDFDRQKPIDRYIVDFYCKRLKLAIEVDGAYHDRPEVQEHDRNRQTRLEALGIHFLRFTNDEVLEQPESVRQAIETWIRTHGP